ncbi:MAG: hypothetical protein ACLU0O_03440 [Collinsella sp.]
MVKRGASVRRAAFDDRRSAERAMPIWLRAGAAYPTQCPAQGDLVLPRDAGAWNESIARAGSALHLEPVARPAVGPCDAYGRGIRRARRCGLCPRLATCPTEDRDELRAGRMSTCRALDERADEEIRRGVTLVGPHRDEIEFSAGRSAVHLPARASSERWCLPGRWQRWPWRVISWAPPLLLLDDVMGELDAGRRGAFLQLIGDDIRRS